MSAGSGRAIAVEVDGVRYSSARLAAQTLGVGCGTVGLRAHSDKWPTYRWLGATRPGGPPMTYEERRVGVPLIEPDRWTFDRCERRATVMDPNFNPPRAVRRLGWLWCLRCGRPHFSDDVARARMCAECGGAGGDPFTQTPNTASVGSAHSCP